MRGWKTFRQGARWLRSRARGRALVLGYHRIADPPSDPYSLSVAPERFERQVEAIRRHARPVSLGELRRSLARREPIHDAVAITFDDGYADLLTEAVPILERHDFPATVFVIAEALGREYWWETLARILDDRRPVPPRLRLPLEPVDFEWEARNGDPDARLRQELLHGLHRRLLPLPDEQRRAALEALSDWAGVSLEAPVSSRSLSAEEVVRLARAGLIEIGSHSRTHPSLADLPSDSQRSEIQGSKTDLEALIGIPIHSFSYPHGSTSAATARLVRECGYRCACTSRTDVVLPGSDLFDLPRFWIGDWEEDRFSRWLRRWSGRPGAGAR